jgi:hypothetical protein
MDIMFNATDDIKLEVEQWWTFKAEGPWPTDHIESSKNEVADFKKDGTRTVRMRLRNKSEGHYTARFLIDHKNPESFKPLPRVEPNTFRNVRFDFRSLQGMNGNAHVIIDFDIVNSDDSKTVGIALHGPSSLAYSGQVEIIGSLNASDGTEYFIDELNGIKSMHSVVSSLAAIGPHETRHVSLKFIKRATILTPPTTAVFFTLRSEVIVNDDLRSSSYSPGYVADGSIPPGCRIESLYWRIPVRSDAQQ